MVKVLVVLALSMVLLPGAPANAYTDSDVERVRGYAAVLGRAGACGSFMEEEVLKVAAWMEITFKAETEQFLEVFFQEYEQNVALQKSGSTGDDCSKVAKNAAAIQWPRINVGIGKD